MTLEEKAVEYFGVTDNYRKAGWILKNGLLLDFSGRRYFTYVYDVGTRSCKILNDILSVFK
jgi:hypothetical protein